MTPATPKDAPTRAPADGLTRRQLLQRGLWSVAAAAVGAVSGMALFRARAATHVWQLDPDKCAQCGRCETACVLTPSAVKAVHAYALWAIANCAADIISRKLSASIRPPKTNCARPGRSPAPSSRILFTNTRSTKNGASVARSA